MKGYTLGQAIVNTRSPELNWLNYLDIFCCCFFHLWHTHRSRDTWNDGAGQHTSTSLLKNRFFKLIVYFLETLKFVVTTKWLQLSPFIVWKPCGYNCVLFTI